MRRVAIAGARCLRAAIAAPAVAGIVRVQLTLPVRAGLDLEGRRTLGVAPFLVVRQEGQSARLRGRDVDIRGEFERYLLKILRRDTDLTISPIESVSFPTLDLDQLGRDQDFWRALAERQGVDLVLAGSLDFDIQDRSGYRLEEYTSPYDGRTYTRQVLVEQSGFEFDILMQVYDARTGEQLYSDNFKDFRSFEGESVDPVAGMFQNLAALEGRIAGIFTEKEVEASRVVFTN
jgi:hypothetical protein